MEHVRYWSGGPVPLDEWNVIPVPGQCFAADFSGDKKTDLARSNGVNGNWNLGLSTGSGWQTNVWSGGPVPVYEWNVIPVPGQCFTGDFNGDGIADVACYSGSNGVCAVGLSSGKGW